MWNNNSKEEASFISTSLTKHQNVFFQSCWELLELNEQISGRKVLILVKKTKSKRNIRINALDLLHQAYTSMQSVSAWSKAKQQRVRKWPGSKCSPSPASSLLSDCLQDIIFSTSWLQLQLPTAFTMSCICRDKKKNLNVKKDLQQKQGRQPTGIKKLFYGRFRKERLNKRLNVFTL